MPPREPNLADRYQRPYRMPRPAPAEPVHALDRAAAAKPRRQRKGAGSRPNVAVTAEYQRRLDFLVLSMHTSVLYWMTAAYRQHEPVMAQDGDTNGLDVLDTSGFLRNCRQFRNLGFVDDKAVAKAEPTLATTLLTQARGWDRMGYSLGLHDVRIVPDRSKWHSYYDFGKDQIVTEGKFWRAPAADRLHMMLHEIGHRGQDADRSGYEAFKREHLNKLASFEDMANPAHLHDERAGHLHNIAEEVWAESYARWCLGLPMPDELKEFWGDRFRGGLHACDGDFHPGGGVRSAAELKELWDDKYAGRDRTGIRGGIDSIFSGCSSAVGSNNVEGMAFDRTPADYLRSAFARLRRRWEERFDDAAGKLARWFAQSAATRSDERLRRILKDGGLSVKFTPTKAMRDVMAGTVQANVALIKSIPEKYLTQVEGMVMRSVQTGRDLHQLSNDLRHELGVTKRRAAFISLDQSNKATSAMTRARQIELGMKAIWRHSRAGKEPRPKHVAADSRQYDPAVGLPIGDRGQNVFPGEEIGCRCYSQTVIQGFKP